MIDHSERSIWKMRSAIALKVNGGIVDINKTQIIKR